MKPSEKAKTPLVIVTGLFLISIITGSTLLAKVAVVIGLCCVFSDFIAHWITIGWIKLAEALGWISSRIILTTLFFIFLLPLAIVKRMFTSDDLHLKKNKRDSLFETRNHQYTGDDLENTF